MESLVFLFLMIIVSVTLSIAVPGKSDKSVPQNPPQTNYIDSNYIAESTKDKK